MLKDQTPVRSVLHVSMQPLAGAAETLHWLKQQGYPTCQ
jgi:hypothetical protein